MSIVLPNEIDRTSRRPRTAIGFDAVSGVEALASRARRILLVGQRRSAGTVAANVPTDLFRPTDAAGAFGDGSMIDLAARALFKANPRAQVTAVAVDDDNAGTAASQTITFANNALVDCACTIRVGMRRVTFAVNAGDTPTVQATAARDKINGDVTLGFTAARTNGVLTITWKHKGTCGNGMQLEVGFSVATALVATTATRGAASLANGATDPEVDDALAACAGERYHLIGLLFSDSTNGGHLKTHVNDQGAGEVAFGELGIQVVNGALSTATTLASALNGPRNLVFAINSSPANYGEIVGALVGVMASETDPARPYNTMVLPGITAPTVDKRWAVTEQDTLLNGGVSPLIVGPADAVQIQRAVVSYVLNAQSIADYSQFDCTIIQSFDAIRDDLKLMFTTRYGRSKWADDDAESNLPADVATPSAVKQSILEVMRAEERLGIVQHVEANAASVVVERVDTSCVFSVPADIVPGLHEILGKVVLIRNAFTA